MRGLPSKEKPGRKDLALHYLFWVLSGLRKTPLTACAEDERPLWRDYSYWNGLVNGGVASANGVRGGFCRAGISWGYEDPTFPNFWTQFGMYEMYRSSYHVIYTAQSIIAQADKVWYKVHPNIEVVPRMIDLQVNDSDEVGHKAEAVWDMSELTLRRDGERPIIYSRVNLLNPWLASWTTEMLNSHYFMLAQYLSDPTREHPGPPDLPNRVRADRVLWQQTADSLPGFPGEVQNKVADRDRWLLGSQSQMDTWIAINWKHEQPIEDDMYIFSPLVPYKMVVTQTAATPTNLVANVAPSIPTNGYAEVTHLTVRSNSANTGAYVRWMDSSNNFKTTLGERDVIYLKANDLTVIPIRPVRLTAPGEKIQVVTPNAPTNAKLEVWLGGYTATPMT